MEATFDTDIAAVAAIDAIPKILDVVCSVTGLGVAAVARATEDRWVTCAFRDDLGLGLAVGSELKVGTAVWSETRQSGRMVVIDHLAEDLDRQGDPTPDLHGFQSYISVPLKRKGQFFGTLCAIDPRPARLNTPEIVHMFTLFADLIGMYLDVSERLAVKESELKEERVVSALREEFIAVLGHDLRNPLAAIDVSALVLLASPPVSDGLLTSEMALRVRKSTARMGGLIDNLMDFARGRLGGGFTLNRVVSPDLDATLEHVVAEMRARFPERIIESDIVVDSPVSVDPVRVSQLLSNLLSNGLTHGRPEGPVTVRVRNAPAGFELSVMNQGIPIPPEKITRLFQPFTRGGSTTDSSGLGLGLYIASEIAKAHGGTLAVNSGPQGTRFTFRIPPDC